MSARSLLAAIGRFVRDGWLILGVTLLLFLILEFSYRGVRAVRSGGQKGSPVVDSSQHPYAREPWWPELQRDLNQRRNQFDPYRGHWAQPLRTRFVNIDSLGRRVTPQASPSEPARDLYLFGGSTAWGFTARDSGTIGAYMARALADRGVKDVRVVNLAQAAFNTTQENVTLLLSLTQHERPAAAVFLDGYNDVTTGWKYREPGHTFGDDEIPIRIRLGARGFWGELFGLGRHAEIVQSLRGRLIGDDSTSKPSGPAPCGAIAEYYRSMATSADALAAANGFVAVHFLQPVPATGGKVRTEWEKRLPPQRPLGPCMASIDSAMADRKGTTFVNLKSVFDSVQGSVFIDNVHITEDGNRLVAEQIANFMAPLLSAPPKPSSPAFKQR